ncbi:MAG TPA: hypothetical protein VJM11_12020 [Nevskiaceae bacterium]|nr:hypothetical protein [Nevskiaceae bacterium]
MSFPLDAHHDSLCLALLARKALARGRELLGTDALEAQEQFMNAWDYAREAGMVCGRHDLPAPFALTQVKELMVAFEDGEMEGASERECELEAQIDLFAEAA